jgi:hypothetical protein
MPARIAEGDTGKPATPTVPSASPSASPSAPKASEPELSASTAPDPEPLRTAEQVEYELELSGGEVRVLAMRNVKLNEAKVTARRMGRYAIELGIGRELIERVRFDFPGTAADEVTPGPERPLSAPLTLSARAIVRLKVQVPYSARVRRAVLVDRALERAQVLPWPEAFGFAAKPAAAAP